MNGEKETCPEGRISSPTKLREGRRIVDVTTYIPYFLSSVNNAMSSGASAHYLGSFNIGIVDWRVISMLAIEPDIPASRICDVISLDKGAASRSLKKLCDQGLVDFKTPQQDTRRRTWALNDKGYDLHDRVLAVALERERRLIRDIDPDDLEVFLRVIRIMRQNVSAI